jgi:U3 small nucleolar RNA-associated protein 13
MASLPLKKNYRCVPSLQQFYTGGPFAVASDGSFIACACDESIRIVDSSDASIRSTIDTDSDAPSALALSPDWDLSTLKCVRSWKVNASEFGLSLVCCEQIEEKESEWVF